MLKEKREKTIKSGGKVPTTVYFTEEQMNALKAESNRTGAPVAEVVRRSVEVYLRAQGDVQFATIQHQMADLNLNIKGRR
jgi:DUF971 family protein